MTFDMDRRVDERSPADNLIARVDGQSYALSDISMGGTRIVGLEIAVGEDLVLDLEDKADGAVLAGIGAEVVASGAGWVSVNFVDMTYALMSFVTPRLR